MFGLSVRLSVHTTSFFSNLNEIWCAGRSRRVIHDCMPYDPIQGQDHRGSKCATKSISNTNMHVIKRMMVNYDTPRQYLNFNRTDFDIHSCSALRDLRIGLFHLWQTNFASYEESTGSPVWAYFF